MIDRKGYQRLYELTQARESFYEFFKQAWPVMEGDVQFVDGWHIKAICDHLQAAYERKVKKLLINVPPRSSKSSICSIAFPAWVWIKNPGEQFMYASYSSSLSMEHSVKCRRLIESPWFQSRWGDLFYLSKDQNTKGFFSNDKLGSRKSTSVNGSSTGSGASILVCDDILNVREGQSEVARKAALDFWTQTWSSRLNDPQTGVKIVVMQRLHEEDVAGHIMKNEKDWVKLIIPMEVDISRKTKTVALKEGASIWIDPRVNDGDLLSPTRFTKADVDSYKKNLGSYGYAGQYQQSPAPSDGGIFKRDWFSLWKKDRMPFITSVIQSWDTAFSDKQQNDYSVCTTWGIFSSSSLGQYVDGEPFNCALLLSLWKGRAIYPDLRDRVVRLSKNYMDVWDDDTGLQFTNKPDIILIEEKGSGQSIIQDLHMAGVSNIYGRIPNGDKISRAHLVSPLVEMGIIYLAYNEKSKSLKQSAQAFLNELILFPKAKHDDIVDTFTQFLAYAKETGLLTIPIDPKYDSVEENFDEVKYF